MSDIPLDGVTRSLIAAEDKSTNAVEKSTAASRELTRALKSSQGNFGGRSPGAPAGSASTSSSGGVMMPGALASVPTAPGAAQSMRLGGAANVLAGALGVVGGLAQFGGAFAAGALNLMPEVQPTINRAAQFYNASVAGGGLLSRAGVRQATFNAMKGGMTSVGSDGMVAEYLANRGMVTDTNRNSTYMQTVRSVSNAAKYLNMSNDRASVAIEGLTSGTMSRNLLQNLGIYTGDINTGKAKTQGQIMSEIGQRLTAGRGQATVGQVEESFRRGNLGASLAGLGLSEDQQLIMKQFLIEQAKGNYLDLSNDKTMEKLARDAGVNPNQSAMTIMGMQTGAMNKAEEAYIKGMQDAVPWMKKLTDASGDAAKTFGRLKAAIETVAGSREGGAVIGALSTAMQGLTDVVTGLATGFAGLVQMLGTGGLARGIGAASSASSGLATAAGAAAAVLFTYETFKTSQETYDKSSKYRAQGKDPWAALGETFDVGKNGWNVMNYIPTVAMQNLQATTLAANQPVDKNGRPLISGIPILDPDFWKGRTSKEWDKYYAEVPKRWSNLMANLGTTAATNQSGGPSSTVGATGPSGSTSGKQSFTFIMPVNGKVVEGYGPRQSFMTASGNMSSSFHNGIDIAASEGTPIHASADGQVISAAPSGGFGNLMRIKHPNGYTTFYAHQSRFGSSVGAQVKQGEVIGYVGTTGNSTGPHLHFEVHDEKGNAMDPMRVLNGTFAGMTAQGSNPSHRTSGAGAGVVPDLNSIIDQRAKADIQVPSSHSGSASGPRGKAGGTDRYGSGSVAGVSAGKGNRNLTSGKNTLTNNRMSISLPGLESYKTGRSYVPQDGPVNVHAGEAILTSEQAEIWRSALKTGMGGKGNAVTINLTIGTASDAEAERFAHLVKRYLEDDQMIHTMGRH